jgi:hypothetical protein
VSPPVATTAAPRPAVNTAALPGAYIPRPAATLGGPPRPAVETAALPGAYIPPLAAILGGPPRPAVETAALPGAYIPRPAATLGGPPRPAIGPPATPCAYMPRPAATLGGPPRPAIGPPATPGAYMPRPAATLGAYIPRPAATLGGPPRPAIGPPATPGAYMPRPAATLGEAPRPAADTGIPRPCDGSVFSTSREYLMRYAAASTCQHLVHRPSKHRTLGTIPGYARVLSLITKIFGFVVLSTREWKCSPFAPFGSNGGMFMPGAPTAQGRRSAHATINTPEHTIVKGCMHLCTRP